MLRHLLHRTANSNFCSRTPNHALQKAYVRYLFKKPQERPSTEITFPVPYGVIAARCWGPDDGLPVLAIHDWQDNANSFSRLVPLLSSKFRIVAIDLPGHGRSSHIPSGTHYCPLQFLIDFQRVLNSLGWSRCAFLTHSIGTALGLMFAGLYPSQVPCVVAIDMATSTSPRNEHILESMASYLGSVLESENQATSRPAVQKSKEVLVRKTVEGRLRSITRKSAEVLLERASKSLQDGSTFALTDDVRLPSFLNLRLDFNTVKETACRFNGDLLIIMAKDSLQKEPDEITEYFVNLFEQNCRRFDMIEVEGSHHVHLNEPKKVAPLVNKFLLGSKDFLRES